MKRKIVILIIGLVMLAVIQADLNEQAIENIFADELLNTQDIYQQIMMFNDYQDMSNKGIVMEDSLADGSPWFYYIPESYDLHQRHGLIIWLHGGVGREDYFEPDEYWFDHPIIDYAKEADMLVLMPMARGDCMWWESAGEKHVIDELLIMKERYNIDDDRVFMTGFSDGGSGSFHFGYRLPNEFAAFYPLNGMISVPAHVTGKPCFIKNLQNRYLRAVNTDQDGLYPAASTRLTMNLALSAGADISYREYWGLGHDWGYSDEDLPLIMKDIQKRARDSFQSEIYWECLSTKEYNHCDWLEVTELDTLAEKQDWQQEYNVQLPDDRISFGFYHDSEFKGDGIMVNKVIESSLAKEMGLKDKDIIIAMDEVTITNIDEMEELKAEKQRGDEVSLTVYREGDTHLLKGVFPEIAYYDAFFYDQPSGAAKAKYYGNIFEIETSRVGALAIYINPEMVNLKIPVKVIINDIEVFNEKVDYESQIMKENIIKNRDRKAIWVNKLKFEIE
ncbi:MAG: PDZ domain-containing protein [Candidatus Stygibacter australis]|nr:PDZ domain-containing protein [Candidatus Stygibacter australis]